MNNGRLDSCCLDDMSDSGDESLVANESTDNQIVGHIPVKKEPTESSSLLDACVSNKESWMDEFRFSNDVTKSKCIQAAIKEVTEALNHWDSKLRLGVFVYGTYTEKVGILEAIDENKRLLLPYLYFDPSKFPSLDGFKGKEWSNLLQHLERESFSEGYSLCCNGYGRGAKFKHREIVCNHSILYRNSMQERKSKPGYRVTRSSNDRLNSRGPIGRKMARRSRTCRPTVDSECCPFFFVNAFDESGFYVRNSCGCSNHVGHPKISSDKNNYKVRLLTDHEKLIAKSVIDANACEGVVRNIIRNQTGQTVSLNACHYLGTLGKDLKRLACLDNLSSSDQIIIFFRIKIMTTSCYTIQ